MRLSTLLAVLMMTAAPALGQQAQIFDPQTAEPIPLATMDQPAELPSARSAVNLVPLVHLPEGSTKAVRFLNTEPHAALIQNGAAVVTFTWALPTRSDHANENAVELDRHVFSHQPSDIFVDDAGRAFVALRQGGVAILDVFIPTEIIPRGTTEEFDALAIVVKDGVAYVGGGFDGLRIFDVSNLDLPTQIGSIGTGGSANGLHAEEDRLYVANGNPSAADNFLIFDVSTPAEPQLLGSFDPDGFVTNVAVRDNVAYLSGAFGLLVLDVADPAAPVVLDSFAAGGQTTYEVAIHDDRLAVSGLAGVFVLDITDPASLELIDSVAAGQGLSTDIADLGGFSLVLLGDRYIGANVLRFHEGTYNGISLYRNGGFSHKAAFAGNNRLYVTDLAGGLRIFNVDEAQSGVALQLSRLPVPSNTQWPLVRDGLAYVADADTDQTGLTIVDVTSSSAPEVIGTWASDNQAFGLDLDGNVIFLANGFGGLTAVDVSDPDDPETIGTLALGSNIVDVAVHEDVAFVISFGGGMIAVDVSDPAAMSTISAQATWGFLNAIDLEHELVLANREYAYVADGQQGLRVVDIEDPQEMISVATFPMASQARDVAAGLRWGAAVNTPVAYVADDFFGLRVIDLAENEEVARFRSADRGIGVAAQVDPANDLVALASGETGVYLFAGATVISTEQVPTAEALALDAAYPNPVRSSAVISFRLAEAGDARVDLFDVLGRRVAHLAGGTYAPGAHELVLDASDLASGIYLVRLSAAGQTATRRITVVR